MSKEKPIYGGEAQVPEALLRELRQAVPRIAADFAPIFRQFRWVWALCNGVPSQEKIAAHICKDIERMAQQWLRIAADGSAAWCTRSGGIRVRVELEHDGSVEVWQVTVSLERDHHFYWSPQQDEAPKAVASKTETGAKPKPYWAHAKRMSKEVKKWPAWKLRGRRGAK